MLIFVPMWHGGPTKAVTRRDIDRAMSEEEDEPQTETPFSPAQSPDDVTMEDVSCPADDGYNRTDPCPPWGDACNDWGRSLPASLENRIMGLMVP